MQHNLCFASGNLGLKWPLSPVLVFAAKGPPKPGLGEICTRGGRRGEREGENGHLMRSEERQHRVTKVVGDLTSLT